MKIFITSRRMVEYLSLNIRFKAYNIHEHYVLETVSSTLEKERKRETHVIKTRYGITK